jgi:hypothetical protein
MKMFKNFTMKKNDSFILPAFGGLMLFVCSEIARISMLKVLGLMLGLELTTPSMFSIFGFLSEYHNTVI